MRKMKSNFKKHEGTKQVKSQKLYFTRFARQIFMLAPSILFFLNANGQSGLQTVAQTQINIPNIPSSENNSNIGNGSQTGFAGAVSKLTGSRSGESPSSDTSSNSTGELISLEYRNAPFVEVIRTLAEGANINITLSAEVEKGSPVSIRLNRVTYEQALKAILETYKFGSVSENGILKIDTLSNLAAVREERLKEKESTWKTVPTKRLVWQVNYAKAFELQSILESMLRGYKIDPRFSIVADKRTNKLIIEGIPDALVEAKSILESLDKLKQQVLIEARIVEASSELSKTLSVTWGTRFGLDGNRGLANNIIFPNSFSGSMGGAGALGSSAPGPGLAKAPTQLGTLQFTVGSINNLVNIDAVLRAYETESLANVIASPRIVVQDQEKANIRENVTLTRSVLGADGKPENRITVASISLQVAPQITSENTLELDINVERQTPTNPASDPVQGSITRNATTRLVVTNGETAVIGGLYQTQKFKGQGRIPFLGRLPIIGGLFRSNEEQSFRSELMVLITPRILPSAPGRTAARANVPQLNGAAANQPSNNFSNGHPNTAPQVSTENGRTPKGSSEHLESANDFGTNVATSAPGNISKQNTLSNSSGSETDINNLNAGAGKSSNLFAPEGGSEQKNGLNSSGSIDNLNGGDL